MSNETGRRSTVEEDLVLYDRLLGGQPIHASPAEHQATPDEYDEGGLQIIDLEAGNYHRNHAGFKHLEEHGNFRGWRQFRKMLPGEACAPLPEGYAR